MSHSFSNIDLNWDYLRWNALLSTKRKLLYVATPKVACTSIKWWFARLEGYGGALQGASEDSKETAPELIIHDSLHRVAPQVAGLPPEGLVEAIESDDYFRFALVRNPFKRIFSAWQSKLLLREPLQVGPYRDKIFYHHPVRTKADVAQAFEMFLEHLADEEAPTFWDVHWTPQVKLLMPDVIRYSVLSQIENISGLETSLGEWLGEEMPSPFANRGANESLLPYQAEFISERSAGLIRQLYAEDFERFGYGRDLPESKEGLSSGELELALKAIEMIRARHERIGVMRGVSERRLHELQMESAGKDQELNMLRHVVVDVFNQREPDVGTSASPEQHLMISPRDSAYLYWCSEADNAFDESRKVEFVASESSRLIFQLPELPKLFRLRLDPSIHSGRFDLFGLRIAQTLIEDFSKRVGYVSQLRLLDGISADVSLVAVNDDPYIEFDVSDLPIDWSHGCIVELHVLRHTLTRTRADEVWVYVRNGLLAAQQRHRNLLDQLCKFDDARQAEAVKMQGYHVTLLESQRQLVGNLQEQLRGFDEARLADAAKLQGQHAELLEIQQQLARNQQDQLCKFDEARQAEAVKMQSYHVTLLESQRQLVGNLQEQLRGFDEARLVDATKLQGQHAELLEIQQRLARNQQDQFRGFDEARQADMAQLQHQWRHDLSSLDARIAAIQRELQQTFFSKLTRKIRRKQ